MKKQAPWRILSLVFSILLIFTACKGKDTSDGSAKATTDGTITVRLGTDASGIDDKSFNASAWRGITEFYGDSPENPKGRGKYYDYLTAATQDRYEPNLRLLSDGGYDLVIVTGFTWADTLATVAKDYPDQKYLIVDVNWLGNENNNIMQATYAEEQGSFLAGVATALKAKEAGAPPKFGFIGGIPGAVITRFQVGYMQGILSVSPDAEILDYYANDWAAPQLAKVQAESWFNSGVYAIFSAAGATGNGAIQVAKEMRQAGRDVWAIGVDSDQYADGIYNGTDSAILTSMVKRVDISVKKALEDVRDGKFSATHVRFDLANGGVGLPDKNPNLSDSILAAVDSMKQQILSGSLTVDRTVAEFTAAGHLGAGKTLKALDD